MFKHKNWSKNRKSKDETPEICPSLASDSSGLSHNLGDIDLRASSLDINGLLSALNTNMAYESDEESIQESPTLEQNDSFGPLQFQGSAKPKSFARGLPSELGNAPRGPVTGSSSMLAPKLAPVQEQVSTINFTKQKPQSSGRYPMMGQDQQGQKHTARQSSPSKDDDDDDDEELPFATTRQMASAGMARNYLPEISTGIVMTNDKFETYRKSLNSLDMLNRQNSLISTTATSDGEEEDEEADIELTQQERRRKQQVALTRQQQEAHLSVHRQKMNKMVGSEAITSTTFDEIEQNEDDIMEDVPLSILRAHGFPKAHKKTTEPTSPNMAGFDSTTAAGMNAAGAAKGTPSPTRNSTGLINRCTLPPVFSEPTTFSSGRGLVGEIAREEEAKRNRIGRSGNSMIFEGGLPHSESRQSTIMMAPSAPAPAPANPMLNDLKLQMQQMSEMQLQLMQMASGNVTPDTASRMRGYSRAPSIRSFGGAPQPYSSPPFSPSFNGTMNPRLSVNDMSYRARPVRQTAEDEDEDEDEAWRKFAEKRQSIKSQWIATE